VQRIETNRAEPKRITIRLTEDQYWHCVKFKKGSVSELIRDLIDEDIQAQGESRIWTAPKRP
jgi:predicted CopG family antitoxin